MKAFKILFFSLTCLSGIHSASAQWQTIAPTTDVKNSIVFLDELNGIGISNTDILRTNDGGITWLNISQQMGTTWGGHDISFADKRNGIVLKDNSSGISATDYYFTNDSGHSWQNAWTTFDESVNQIQFTSDSIGYVLSTFAAKPGKIYRTTDGGTNWIVLHTASSDTRFSDFEFINDSIGIIAGFKDSIPFIFSSQNGGISWDSTAVNLTLTIPLKIDMVNDSSAYLLSGISGTVYQSTDKFNSWSPIFNNSLLWIKDIQFPSVDTGYFSAYDTLLALDVIYRSIDGGSNWNKQTFAGYAIRDMFFLNAHTGWLCGINGSIDALGGTTEIESTSSVQQELKIYPNPMKDNFLVSFDNPAQKEFFLQIYDSRGKLLQSLESTRRNSIHVKKVNLPNGLYYIHVFTNDQMIYYTGKLLVDL